MQVLFECREHFSQQQKVTAHLHAILGDKLPASLLIAKLTLWT
jgi:hypothetical protein